MAIDLKTIKPKLPRGAQGRLSELTGISRADVWRMLQGMETKQTPKLISAIPIYLSELERDIKDVREALQL